jgi:Fe-S-cluster containining protein
MKCRIHKCKSACCYNLHFENGELERYADKIVNPVIGHTDFFGVDLVLTNEDIEKNKCPFLRADCRCNIYENRPDVCRMMGVTDRLPCKWIKK